MADTSVLVDNGEWNILEIPVRRKVKIYPCCIEPFPEVTFYFVMQRQYLYYMFNLVSGAKQRERERERRVERERERQRQRERETERERWVG